MYRYAHKNVRPFSAVCHNNYGRQVEKSKEYQQLEEQDRLVILPCKYVYYIVDINNPKYAMVMKRPIKERVGGVQSLSAYG